jgi:hypothetical protein
MSVDRNALRKQLEDSAANQTARAMVQRTMDLLEPLFKLAEKDEDEIVISPPKGTAVVTTLSQALGLKQCQVLLVRATELNIDDQAFRRPWMTDEAYRSFQSNHANLTQSLRQSVAESVGTGLMVVLAEKPGMRQLDLDGIPKETSDALSKTLNACLYGDLRDALAFCHRVTMSDEHWAQIRSLLYHHLGFTILGDEKRAGQTGALIKLLPSCWPIGEKSHNPGVWICLNFSRQPDDDPLYPGGRKPQDLPEDSDSQD